MIEVSISPQNKAEKDYVLDVVFDHFLGIGYSVNSWEEDKVSITLPNEKKIVFDDTLLSNREYLNEDILLNSVSFISSDFCVEENLPVLIGDGSIIENESGFIIGIDILGTIFFMLTRLEEYVINKKDKHDRILESELFVIKNNIHLRPIVNEYTEFLWNLLKHVGYKGRRKVKKYSIFITHDVDEIQRYPNLKRYFRAIVGDLILRKNPLLVFKTTWEFLMVKLKLIDDPYDTFNWLMDQSESIGLKSHFYFIPAKGGEEDYQYDINSPRAKKAIDQVRKRGHFISLHGSYGSYNNKDRFKNELCRLERIYPNITEVRQHFLRFEVPTTWNIQEEAGMKIDSSIGFYHNIGFRAGTCFDFPVFDLLGKRKLNLFERPLTIMEGPLVDMKLNERDFIKHINHLSDIVKKYNGCFVLLWHSNTINHPYYKKYSNLYSKILKIITK